MSEELYTPVTADNLAVETLVEPHPLDFDETLDSTFRAMQRYSALQQEQARAFTNNTPSIQRVTIPALPPLPTREVTGYIRGRPFPLTASIVTCRGRQWLLEEYTAHDYLLMRAAAARDGITLRINSAFRTNEDQARLARERAHASVRRTRGAAAPAGYGDHQAGISVDIQTGTGGVEAFEAGARSPTYNWLEANAADYGFARDNNEPWHWTHKEKQIFGQAEASTALNAIVGSDGELVFAAAASSRDRFAYYVHKDTHDDLRAIQRSVQLSTMTRAELGNVAAVAAAHASTRASRSVAMRTNLHQSASVELEGFTAESIDPIQFDFVRGTWGDGEAV